MAPDKDNFKEGKEYGIFEGKVLAWIEGQGARTERIETKIDKQQELCVLCSKTVENRLDAVESDIKTAKVIGGLLGLFGGLLPGLFNKLIKP